jgi:putative ABC transport system permease protein
MKSTDKRHDIQPPGWAVRILLWLCPEQLSESIIGDLKEQFSSDLKSKGSKTARRRFILNAIKFMRPGILIRRTSHQAMSNTLWYNYFLTAKRNFWRNKTLSAVNIFGIAMGLLSCLFILQYVSYHLSFDSFHENSERIFRITNDRYQDGKLVQHGTITYPTIGPAMAKDYPEIEMFTRIMPSGEITATIGDEITRGGTLFFADQNFFKLFTFSWVAGDLNSALSEPNQIVLSETGAAKIFKVPKDSVSDLIGKSFKLNNRAEYHVVGIFHDMPANSHLQFEAIASYISLYDTENRDADESWVWSDFYHYLLLKPGASAAQLESKFDDFSARYFQGEKVSGSIEEFYLQSLSEIHLYSDYEYDFAITENGTAVWTLGLIALFILLLAWINYLNLTTSRAIDRVMEISIRKSLGANRYQITNQFIIESLMVCVVAILLSLGSVILLQPYFNELTALKLSLAGLLKSSGSNLWYIIFLLFAGIILTGIISASFLWTFNLSVVLKGRSNQSVKGRSMRKTLVVVQFSIAATLIIGTLVVSRQLQFMNKANLGISINNRLIIEAPYNSQFDSTFISRIDNFKNEIQQLNFVEAAATANRWPGRRLGRGFNIRLSKEPESAGRTMSWMGTDHDYFRTYDIKLLAGRFFAPTDHHRSFNELRSVIVNENAVHNFGFESNDQIIGAEILSFGRPWTVIGVVNNYHQESFHAPMEPILFFPFYGTGNTITIKLTTDDYQNVMSSVKSVYDKFFPGNLFDYFFLEDYYKRQYSEDQQFGDVIVIFTGMAILISILGLMGLASFTAARRVKELGIRKVLGASVIDLVKTLSKDFIILIGIAIFIAIPISYYFMRTWLNDYVYKITLSWELFAGPVIIILGVAVLTIASQIYKAARTNPVETLKME